MLVLSAGGVGAEMTEEELDQVLEDLIKKGLVEWAYGEDGKKLYKLTNLGQSVAVQLDQLDGTNERLYN